ncbi:MAG: lysophospholipid acyltransferase family protein [Candidatus Omnitrophica bacterium]|nr:lysophospholipid acyltransferase family protein [Candidatus Omnitrophota bacterium]
MTEKTVQPIRKVQSQAEIHSLKFLQWAVRYLPLWLLRGLMEVMFVLAYYGLGQLRKIGFNNLKQAYGSSKTDKECRAMTRSCIKNIGRSMVDMIYYAEHVEKFMGKVLMEGEQHLVDALEYKRGVIAVTAHMGNFPLMFLALVQKGYTVNVIIRPMRDTKFSKFMYKMCARWGINMIQTLPRRKFVTESLAALNRNELLFILSDEAVSEENGVPADFFNTKVFRTPGPMVFHDKTQSPMLPVFIAKEEKEMFRIYIQPPVNIEKYSSKDETIQKNINTLAYIIESFICQYPIQWGGWLNKRWEQSQKD